MQTPSHLYWSSLISNSECFVMVLFWRLPRCVPEHPLKFSPLSAPHQTKEKRTAPLALSPRCHSFSMSLALRSPALCSSLSADAPTAAATFDGKQMSKNRHRCAGEDGGALTWGLGAPGASPCVAEKVWEGTSSFFVVESPFVYTCDRWMGLLLAAPSSFRSPKSPALSKSNYAQDWDWSLVNTYANVFDFVCFFN